MRLIIKYLKSKEWSMGNGQCPECCGNKPRMGWWTKTVGHKKDCLFAKMLEEVKVKPIYERLNHSKERRKFEKFGRDTVQRYLDMTQNSKEI